MEEHVADAGPEKPIKGQSVQSLTLGLAEHVEKHGDFLGD